MQTPALGRTLLAWWLRLACVLAVTAVAALLHSPVAQADSWGNFCPPTGGATMSIAPGNDGMCIHGIGSHWVTIVHVWRVNNGSAQHCAGAHSSPSGGASHVIGYSCGVGDPPDGHRETGYNSSGIPGYPIHKNNASVTLSGFYSGFSFRTGTLMSARRAASAYKPRRAGAAVASALSNAFGVLGRPRTTGDGLGRFQVGPGLDGVYVDQTRAVPTRASIPGVSGTRDDSKIWVAGGSDGRVCLLRVETGQDGPASQCLPPEWVAQGKQILTTEFSESDIAVAGILPDGVSAALLVLKDGRTLTVPVIGNVYRARLDSGVRSVSFTARDGKPVTFMLDGTA